MAHIARLKHASAKEKCHGITPVTKGETCGCAERIIDVFEFNRIGGAPSKQALKQGRRKR
ncbi:hypothetical protein SAMN05444358_1079 [Ruegeria halocynthiae]|uniref:Uncharacterized protein n=1 Tax=Ruegeria halocynthiae TaxID=985054 RepID=A0A1H3CH37_9RHOB|nr:hypothetical protein [Ruegeria halocynthiae]SDX53330.1 hypothetical protein SAMN05444358_1079 [Ruegeria halocynthiae]